MLVKDLLQVSGMDHGQAYSCKEKCIPNKLSADCVPEFNFFLQYSGVHWIIRL